MTKMMRWYSRLSWIPGVARLWMRRAARLGYGVPRPEDLEAGHVYVPPVGRERRSFSPLRARLRRAAG